jgi:hypothetical protein
VENHRILSKRNTTNWPRAIVVGAIFGAGCTLLLQFLMQVFGRGEAAIGLLIGIPWSLSIAPARALVRSAGGHWYVGSVYMFPVRLFLLTVAVNALLGTLFAIIVVGVSRLRNPFNRK